MNVKKHEANSSTRIDWIPLSGDDSSLMAWRDWLDEERKTMFSRFGIPERYLNYGFKQNRNPTNED